MNTTDFTFDSPGGEKIFVYKWTPDGKARAAVQIAHGMTEHGARYERLARSLTGAGFAVYANDHRGHGKTAGTPERGGIYAERDGFRAVIEDMHTLTGIIKKENPGVPVFLLGHSMGSFLSQGYVSLYGNELAGLVLSGSAGDNRALARMGRLIARIICVFRGRTFRSRLLDTLSFGAFNKPFAPNRTAFDWLSRDAAEVDKYVADPWCGFLCTAGFFYDLASGLVWIHTPSTVNRVPRSLPVLAVAGSEDPVGGKGKLVRKLVRMYETHGIRDLTWKLYPGARHEILNETNRDEVTADILEWLSKRV